MEGKRRSFETRAPLTSSDGAAREEIELGVERTRPENEAGSPKSILASASEKDSNSSGKEINGYCKSLQAGRLGSVKDPKVKILVALVKAGIHQE